MKTATKAMYVIGLIINIVVALGCLVATLIYGISMGNNEVLEEIYNAAEPGTYESVAAVKALFTTVFVVFLILLIIKLITIWVGIMGIKKANDEKGGQVGFHVAALILGMLSGEIFYILGGIFGLVNEGKK